ncbi:hypothetical protein QUA82_10630 [Microcoleus sp. F8-D3]
MSDPQQFGLFLIANTESNKKQKIESFMTYAQFPDRRDNHGDYP